MEPFVNIVERIKINPNDWNAYKQLGDHYMGKNVNQAYLCYEQARGLCKDEIHRAMLYEKMEICSKCENFEVNPASFVILSYNSREMMIECLESIRKNCVPGSYEIVVVDNCSSDGIREYLMEQKDLKLRLNETNTSFAVGCNQGARLTRPENDIFLLNNDTVVPPLALFYLRMGLYADEMVGAAGPTSNAVKIAQLPDCSFSTKEEWLNHTSDIHLPGENCLEYMAWLVGFALLIKRKAWDFVGNLDERFVRGNFEDTDWGFRLNLAGYKSVLCHNSFIFHYGSVSMKKDLAAYNKSLKDNEERLNRKLGIEFHYFMPCRREIVDSIQEMPEHEFSVLEIGCGFGHTLSRLQYRYPRARVVGIEKEELAAKIGNNITNIICADVEKEPLPFEKEQFDYIIMADVVNHFEDAKEVLLKIKGYLKPEGKLYITTPNPMRAKTFLAILKGKYATIDSQYMDSKAKHFYTKDEMIGLLSEAGIPAVSLLNMVSDQDSQNQEEKDILEAIKNLSGVTIGKDFHVENYVFTAQRRG